MAGVKISRNDQHHKARPGYYQGGGHTGVVEEKNGGGCGGKSDLNSSVIWQIMADMGVMGVWEIKDFWWECGREVRECGKRRSIYLFLSKRTRLNRVKTGLKQGGKGRIKERTERMESLRGGERGGHKGNKVGQAFT